MKSTLIISTYNWPEALKLVFESVLRQTILVDEIIIADDGSLKKTRFLIDDYRKYFDIPLIHVWHEDLGFRKTIILNKAYYAASGDYIIQIDGDVILHPNFIKDHIKNAEKSRFIHGGRVLLNENITFQRLQSANINFYFFHRGLKNRINSIYSPFLSRFFSHKSTSLKKTRGCNFSCWKEDFFMVNGYNENMVGWGLEDTELSCRLINNNVFKKRLKFIALTYHMYHKINKQGNYGINSSILSNTINQKIKFCKNGVNNYS